MTSKRVVVYSRAWRYGVGLYAQGVARGLSEAGYPVTFIAPAGDPDGLAHAAPSIRRIQPVRELIIPASRLRRLSYSFRRTIKGLCALVGARLTSSRFVVTIPDPFVFSIWFLLFLRLTGARVVYVCHDPEPHTWELPNRLRWIERAGYEMMCRIASQIVVLATSAKNALVRIYGLPASKITVVPHGTFPIESAGPSPDSRALLLFGTIRRNKSVHRAILGVLAARDSGCPVNLIIAGEADPSDLAYVDECRAIVGERGDGIVFEQGYVADARITELLKTCDAVLLPYADFESQSGVAILAGIAGRPVIATIVGGIRDLVDSGLTAVEIAPPGDVESIAAAILDFYAVPQAEWTARTESSRQQLLRALDWAVLGQRFGTLLDAAPRQT